MTPQRPHTRLLALFALITGAGLSVATSSVMAQETNTVATELEFGAIFTSGNSDDQNVKFKGTVDWNRGDWIYGFSSDGFRSSKNSELNAQRLYHVGRAGHTINEFSFVNARVSYEDDRFSGFDSQSDFSVNYGRNFLRRSSTMTLAVNVGLGMRRSEQAGASNNEAIGRFEGNYVWNLSQTAAFTQDFSLDSGSDSSIIRSESGIQSQVMDNLSLRFSIKLKHQTQVPFGREKTDTETAATLVLSF